MILGSKETKAIKELKVLLVMEIKVIKEAKAQLILETKVTKATKAVWVFKEFKGTNTL